jgi:uncharacterized protein
MHGRICADWRERAFLSERRIKKPFRRFATVGNLRLSAVRIRMKTSLDHLPLAKQRELEHVTAVLTEEFDKARAKGDQRWRRSGKILKMILFGSFSRDDWVDEPHNGYQSDWDLLIIVNHERLTEIEDFWWEAEERLLHDEAVGRPVNIIVHTLAQVNQALKQGAYFWVDVVSDGVMLFERSRYHLATPQPLTPGEAYEMAQEYFSEYSISSANWLETAAETRAKIIRGETWAKKTAFNLHQTVETAYACFLLVRTLYLPKSHNIKFLRSLSEGLDKRLIPAWPREAKKDTSRFELLKRAYVEARYSEHYKISAEQLDVLMKCAEELRRLVEEVCQEKLQELRTNAGDIESEETPTHYKN